MDKQIQLIIAHALLSYLSVLMARQAQRDGNRAGLAWFVAGLWASAAANDLIELISLTGTPLLDF